MRITLQLRLISETSWSPSPSPPTRPAVAVQKGKEPIKHRTTAIAVPPETLPKYIKIVPPVE